MKFLFVTFLLPLQLFAQDITGVWTGTLYNDTTKQFIKYELAISEYKGKLSGFSHTIFVINGFENTGLKSIKVKKAGEEFLVEDDKLIYNNYAEPPAKRVKTYSELVLSQNDTAMILSGPWITNRTRVYSSLTGNIFLQKEKKIREALIIIALENFGLTGSLSFMTLPARPKDLAIIDNRGFNPDEPIKPVEIAGILVSNTEIPVNTEIQQDDKQSKAGSPNSGEVLNKDDFVKEKTETRGMQLPLADKTIRIGETTDVILPGSILVKSSTQQIDKQQETGEKIPGKGMNKHNRVVNDDTVKVAPRSLEEITLPKTEVFNVASIKSATQQINKLPIPDKKIPRVSDKDDSEMSKDTVKVVSSPIVVMSTPKKEPANIVSPKSEPTQISQQQQTGKKIQGEAVIKIDSVLNKDLRTALPPGPGEMSTQKKEPPNIVSAKSGINQPDKQHESGKKISGIGLNKVDSAVNKDIVKVERSVPGEIAIPKSETSNIVSIKSDTQQVSKLQKEGKEIPGMVLKNDDIEATGTEKQAVPQAAAEIATRKIETIRSVDIKGDSLLLTLYDNGEIDGDTVSVLLNGKVIMPNQRLMSKAINKTIYLTPEMGDSIVLIMYAENLGSIAPNTGLLVIHDGDEIYEIRFTGDLKKNSSIILRRKNGQ